MAIYRRSSRRPLVIVAVVASLAGLIVGFAIARAIETNLVDQIRSARAQVVPVISSLDVVRDEYPKLLAATAGSDPGGAESALTRATTSLAAQAAVLRAIDPATTADLEAKLGLLRDVVTARAPNDRVQPAIEAARAAAARIAGLPGS